MARTKKMRGGFTQSEFISLITFLSNIIKKWADDYHHMEMGTGAFCSIQFWIHHFDDEEKLDRSIYLNFPPYYKPEVIRNKDILDRASFSATTPKEFLDKVLELANSDDENVG